MTVNNTVYDAIMMVGVIVTLLKSRPHRPAQGLLTSCHRPCVSCQGLGESRDGWVGSRAVGVTSLVVGVQTGVGG